MRRKKWDSLGWYFNKQNKIERKKEANEKKLMLGQHYQGVKINFKFTMKNTICV